MPLPSPELVNKILVFFWDYNVNQHCSKLNIFHNSLLENQCQEIVGATEAEASDYFSFLLWCLKREFLLKILQPLHQAKHLDRLLAFYFAVFEKFELRNILNKD